MITKSEMTQEILSAKLKKKTSWKELSGKLGISDVFLASACLGQNTLNKEEAESLGSLLGLSAQATECLQVYPMKGQGQFVPSDPLIYRFFEIAYVYGSSIKEVIHEKFGDGIMSAIDFSMDIEKVSDPKGDRVKVTMNGKFLPYKKW